MGETGAALALAPGKMIYRKAPPQPPKLLLRIVSAAGAGVLFGVSACGGVANSPISGVAVQTPDDSGDALGDEFFYEGPPLGSSGSPCGGVCGSLPEPSPDADGIVLPPDAGDASDGDVVGVDAGILISPDASDAGVSDASDGDAPIADATADATNHCHVLGICVQPDASHVCLGVCITPDQ